MSDNLIQFFLAMAALAISMAGLASLISLFKSSTDFTSDEIFVFRSIILFSLCIGLAAVIPVSLLILMIDEAIIWMACCSLYALTIAVLLIRLIREKISGKWIVVYKGNAYTLITITILVIIWLVVNAVIIRKPDAYIAGIVWGLIVIGTRLYLFLETVTGLKLKKKYRSK